MVRRRSPRSPHFGLNRSAERFGFAVITLPHASRSTLIDRFEAHTAKSPTSARHGRHEVLNALLMGEKRKRLTGELIKSFIKDLEQLPAEVDAPAAGTVFHATHDLCRKHGLTAYDAAYLELAMRHRIALATADSALESAARAEGVEIV